jgi:transposase
LSFRAGTVISVIVTVSQKILMTKDERLRIWKALLKQSGLNPREAAERLGVHRQTAYSWNSGQQKIPEARLEQLRQLEL